MQQQQTRFHLWLARIISYEENALAILNGPALKWAAVVTAFVMALPALANLPLVSYVWICLVGGGVDVQYIACVRQAAEARGRARAFWVVVAVLLFVPVFQTNAVFSLHTQTGISELGAMDQIHLSPTGWALERAFLLALLMAVSALSRPRQQPRGARVPVTTPPPAPAPAPTPPPAPEPTGPRTRRRDTGRTVEQTEALKLRERPQVIRLARVGMSQRQIAAERGISQFMVREIINESALPRESRQTRQTRQTRQRGRAS